MTIRIWVFREVQQLEDHQVGAAARDDGFAERETQLRGRACRAVFGADWLKLPRSFLKAYEDPPNEQAAQEKALVAGFDLRTDRDVILQDVLIYAALVDACVSRVWGESPEEVSFRANERIAQALEREARHWSNTRGTRHKRD